MRPDTIIFVANSPGEISGWLLPLVHEARLRWPNCRLVLQLTLCEFASGAEERISRELLGIEEVLSPYRYFDMLLRRMAHYKNPLIIHLGGDMFYSALLAKRWGVPLWIYVWGRKWLDRAFTGYFVRNDRDLQALQNCGIPLHKVKVVGDLVADATAFALESQLQHRAEAGPARPDSSAKTGTGPLISFLPGSREHEVSGLSPFFMETAQQIKAQIPDCRFQLIVSPFIKTGDIQRLTTQEPIPELGGVRCLYRDNCLSDGSTTEIEIIHEDQLARLSASSLAVTIPGTKTSELGCLGIPMIAILPLNRPDRLPLTGLLGMLDFIPWLGQRLKKWLVIRFAKRSKLYALPNILAQRKIVPELVDILRSSSVAQEAVALLNNPDALRSQTRELHKLYDGYKGTAKRIFDILGDDSQWPSI